MLGLRCRLSVDFMHRNLLGFVEKSTFWTHVFKSHLHLSTIQNGSQTYNNDIFCWETKNGSCTKFVCLIWVIRRDTNML